MARRLQQTGHRPLAVVLIDPPRRLIEGTNFRRKLLRTRDLLRARWSLRRGGDERTRELVQSLRRQEEFGQIAPTPGSQALVIAAARVALDLKLAVQWHRPRPYRGSVNVIHSRRRAGDQSPAAWRRHVRGDVHFFEAGEEHSDLLLPGNEAFARQLRRCMEREFEGGNHGNRLRQGL
jgi:thioesterase domain-containing protein